MDAKVTYEFRISGMRGKKVKIFREVGTQEWRTITKAARMIDRDPAAVRESIRAGRPITVPSRHYLVVGGDHDGKWLNFTQLSRLTGASPSHCRRLCDPVTATLTWRAPNLKMVEGARGGYRRRRDRGLTQSTKLEGVCHVAAQFNRIAWPCHAS